jgi:hypothetical protein
VGYPHGELLSEQQAQAMLQQTSYAQRLNDFLLQEVRSLKQQGVTLQAVYETLAAAALTRPAEVTAEAATTAAGEQQLDRRQADQAVSLIFAHYMIRFGQYSRTLRLLLSDCSCFCLPPGGASLLEQHSLPPWLELLSRNQRSGLLVEQPRWCRSLEQQASSGYSIRRLDQDLDSDDDDGCLGEPRECIVPLRRLTIALEDVDWPVMVVAAMGSYPAANLLEQHAVTMLLQCPSRGLRYRVLLSYYYDVGKLQVYQQAIDDRQQLVRLYWRGLERQWQLLLAEGVTELAVFNTLAKIDGKEPGCVTWEPSLSHELLRRAVKTLTARMFLLQSDVITGVPSTSSMGRNGRMAQHMPRVRALKAVSSSPGAAASWRRQLLQMSGDVHPNPGPSNVDVSSNPGGCQQLQVQPSEDIDEVAASTATLSVSTAETNVVQQWQQWQQQFSNDADASVNEILWAPELEECGRRFCCFRCE